MIALLTLVSVAFALTDRYNVGDPVTMLVNTVGPYSNPSGASSRNGFFFVVVSRRRCAPADVRSCARNTNLTCSRTRTHARTYTHARVRARARAETYQYYSLPFCRPSKIEQRKNTLGEVLEGSMKSTSLYDIRFGSKLRRVVCVCV